MTREALQAVLASGAGASLDSRTVAPGEVFFGVPGTHQHGGAYARQALDRGAAAVVVPPAFAQGLPALQVFVHPDPVSLLQEEAFLHRQRFPALHVIAVGGSNGKTTTRALLSQIFSRVAPTLFTPKSWNNHLGIPLTLLRIQPEHSYAIIEIGDNRPGEVAFLTRLVRPTWGVITNVGSDHLEGYGSYEANLWTKWELVEALAELTPEPVLFLNSEDGGLQRMPVPANLRLISFGSGGAVWGHWTTQGWDSSVLSGEAYGEPFSLPVQLWGSYNRLNVLAAIAVARHAGITWEVIKETLGAFSPETGRSQIVKRGAQVIVFEGYNANPSSMMASLAALWETVRGKRVGFVLGQMEELGQYAKEAHAAIVGHLLARQGQIEGVALVGPHFADIALPTGWSWFGSVQDLLHHWPTCLETAPVLYLKGSRKAQLERVVERLVGSS